MSAPSQVKALGPHLYIVGEPRRDGRIRYHRVKELTKRGSAVTGCGSIALFRPPKVSPPAIDFLRVFTPCGKCFTAALRGDEQ